MLDLSLLCSSLVTINTRSERLGRTGSVIQNQQVRILPFLRVTPLSPLSLKRGHLQLWAERFAHSPTLPTALSVPRGTPAGGFSQSLFSPREGYAPPAWSFASSQLALVDGDFVLNVSMTTQKELTIRSTSS